MSLSSSSSNSNTLMEQIWFYLISVASPLFLLLLTKLLKQKQTPPPSPPSFPLIGHLHLLKGSIHRTLENLSKRYGSVFILRFGTRSVLVVSSPSAIEECFTKNDIVLANRPRLLSGKHLHYNYTTLAASPYGDHWRNLRRLSVLEVFSTFRLNSFLSIRQEEVQSLLKDLFQISRQGFVEVEMKSRLSELSFNIIMRMVAGKRYFGFDVEDSTEAGQFQDIIREFFELSGASNPGDFVPFLRWIDFRSVEKRLLAVKKTMDIFLDGLIDEYRKEDKTSYPHGERTKTMIDTMLSLQKSEPQYYSNDIIKGMILILLSAGTDTSSATIEWAMSLLLNHPEVLKKARVELDGVVGEDHLVNEQDFSKLPYLQNIISEALRLFPPAPLLVPHQSSDDCTIGGYDVPRGTMLLVNAWAIHRDPKLWEDPTSFKPERFGGEGDVYKFIPFGLGRRSCPGAGLANRIVGLTLAALIQCFEWERISEELVDMSEGPGLTMPKVKPLKVMCKARKTMVSVLSKL